LKALLQQSNINNNKEVHVTNQVGFITSCNMYQGNLLTSMNYFNLKLTCLMVLNLTLLILKLLNLIIFY